MEKMKKLLLAFAIMLVSSAASTATMGVCFRANDESSALSPQECSYFKAFVFVEAADAYLSGLEYRIATPSDPAHALFGISGVSYPQFVASASGNPFEGHSIVFWPPLNGFVPGFNIVCELECFTLASCARDGGLITDFPIEIAPNPKTGALGYTSAPGGGFFEIEGKTATICPEMAFAAQEESWGAIASLYR